jgi:hypothetical protein
MIPGGRRSLPASSTSVTGNGKEVKEQQELEAKKNDPRRQEAIASLFHVRDRDKVGGHDVKEQQDLEAIKNDPRKPRGHC